MLLVTFYLPIHAKLHIFYDWNKINTLPVFNNMYISIVLNVYKLIAEDY